VSVSKTDWVREPSSYRFNTLSFESITPSTTVGASLSSQTSIQATYLYPVNYKIVKLGVSFSAVYTLAGTCSFNLVIGNTLAYTSAQSSAPQNDNSFAPTLQGGSGPVPQVGYATNVAVLGNTVFGADVAINATNFPNAVTTTGGYNTFPNPATPTIMPAYDAVYPGSIPLTLRINTPASGFITNFSICLLMEPVTTREFWFIPSQPTVDVPTPGVSF
jgi:hypothetical protein